MEQGKASRMLDKKPGSWEAQAARIRNGQTDFGAFKKEAFPVFIRAATKKKAGRDSAGEFEAKLLFLKEAYSDYSSEKAAGPKSLGEEDILAKADMRLQSAINQFIIFLKGASGLKAAKSILASLYSEIKQTGDGQAVLRQIEKFQKGEFT